jgi:hypothetical protein
MLLRLEISPTSADDVESVKRAEQLGVPSSTANVDAIHGSFLFGRHCVPAMLRIHSTGRLRAKHGKF